MAMANQIMFIRPYKWSDMWVFDDEAVGLMREAFISGADRLIDLGIEREGIADADKGFILIFSKDPFLGANMVLTWVRTESGGNVYQWEGHEGWLCPALFKYFEKTPERIYVQMKALKARQA
jgi:hypothetical protein